MRRIILVCALAIAGSSALAEDQEEGRCVALLNQSFDFAQKAIRTVEKAENAPSFTCADIDEIIMFQEKGVEIYIEARAVCPADVFKNSTCDAKCLRADVARSKAIRDRRCPR
jgi:hypothetical protein